MEEPGGLQSMGLQRVWHDSDSIAHQPEQLKEHSGVHLRSFKKTVEQKFENNHMKREGKTALFWLYYPTRKANDSTKKKLPT